MPEFNHFQDTHSPNPQSLNGLLSDLVHQTLKDTFSITSERIVLLIYPLYPDVDVLVGSI